MRGDIHRLRSDRRTTGHEQSGARFAVVLQSNDLPLSTAVVAPTSTSARPATFRPEVEIEGTSTLVLVEQLAAVDLSRLGDRVGSVHAAELTAIDQALALVLDL